MAARGTRFRRRPRHRTRKSGLGAGRIAAILAVPAVLIGGGALAMHYAAGLDTADADFCFPREDQAQIAVLIDNSMAGHSAAQLRDYETGLMRPFETAPANARISFFTTALDGQGSLARPVFAICKPSGDAAALAAIGAPSKPAPYLKRQVEEARALPVGGGRCHCRDEGRRAPGQGLADPGIDTGGFKI